MADSIYAPHNNSNNSIDEEDEEISLQPDNPFLTKPLLHLSAIDSSISDQDIAAKTFGNFLPVRLSIDRESQHDGELATGTVEFQTLDKAEKAYATVRGTITLAITEDAADPKPAAKPRLVKHLPPHTDDGMLFDLFRRYGPLARAHCILSNPAGQYTGFRGMGQLDFYDETHAQHAQNEMHCAEVDGKTISVSIDSVSRQPTTSAEFSAAAAPFVPAGARSLNAAAPSFQPPQRTASGSNASIYAAAAPGTPTSPQPVNHQTAGPLYPVPGSNLQFSSSAGTYIDPCNLFIKNIDVNIDSNQLFTTFKSFGRIVSARVMRDGEGNSRGFGFVSFTTAEEASRALATTNNSMLGNQKINVRLHEPKRMREQKLAAKFGADSTSPGGSETGGWTGDQSPEATPSPAHGSPSTTQQGSAAAKKADKRASNSYFKAALSNETETVDAEQLAALTSGVRQEVLSGEFSKRVSKLPTIQDDQVSSIVDELVKMRLTDAVDALNNPIELLQRVTDAREKLGIIHGSLPSVSAPVGNGNGTEAAATQPQQPPSSSSGFLLPPSSKKATGDAASVLSSAPATGKERERLFNAIQGVAPAGSDVEAITDMLVSLPKKERALCLFNTEMLRNKVEEAREILSMSDEEDDDKGYSPAVTAPAAEASSVVPGAPATPADSTRALKDAPVSAAAGSSTDAASSAPQTYTLSTLAALPALEIVRLASAPPSSANSGGLPLPKADANVLRETDAFVDGLSGKPMHDQKQKVGDVLHKKIKAMGYKGAPKLTIALLDSEDLRSLAHLMNSYPEVLREKVQQHIASK
ncbi:unnamed protein product [Tilletia laevis]|uniref:Polyadenylate tail-binding protein n=3 Tax=Tilletia TaxID=13289 RepID=A0A8X7SYL5_9BASI|nr:hypothetical protein CF336_g2014 [Tilletia laevis]KAE8205471.1 hypothetical protein CF328_g489 [Tilletia controversa]KAE8263649.1 hypothetical protein A4X03_0g1527 [Tilletia caries]KAE8207197.1 hypothetical protein CF335_g1320 [Tilletia laevis]KAE8252387.1 hypothetical protein A4X06_0g2223 [Tilletia controversa]